MAKLAQVATARQAQLKDGRRLGFVESGDLSGQPIIFFHDLWGNRSLRHPDDTILKQLNIRLIGIDRPGYGASTRRPKRNMMDVIDDVMILSKALKLDKFSVLGYSAGAPYALACAYRFPQIVTNCTVVASLPPMDDPQGFQAINPNYARLFQLASNMETIFRLMMKAFFWIDLQRSPDRYIAELAISMPLVDQQIMRNPLFFQMRTAIWDEIRQNGSDVFVDEMVTLTQPWGFPLQSIQIPTDIWWGDADTFAAPLIGERMNSLLPNATLHMTQQAGHLILFSHWQAILERIRSQKPI